jgi:chromate transporter
VSAPTPSAAAPAHDRILLFDLFTGFLIVGLIGFGGIAVSGQYIIVEKRKWLTQKEYTELYGVCSIVPGGNVLNCSVVIGDRNHGPLGAIVCLSALLLMPLAILLMIGVAYDTFSYLPDVRAALAGAAAASAGLIFGTAARLARGVTPSTAAALAAIVTFVTVGVLRWPLWVLVVVIAPLSFAWALYQGRRT